MISSAALSLRNVEDSHSSPVRQTDGARSADQVVVLARLTWGLATSQSRLAALGGVPLRATIGTLIFISSRFN